MEFLEFIGNNRSNEKWLEAVASIHYLYERYPYWSKTKIFREIKNKMSRMNMTKFANYLDYLKQYDLIEER